MYIYIYISIYIKILRKNKKYYIGTQAPFSTPAGRLSTVLRWMKSARLATFPNIPSITINLAKQLLG